MKRTKQQLAAEIQAAERNVDRAVHLSSPEFQAARNALDALRRIELAIEWDETSAQIGSGLRSQV